MEIDVLVGNVLDVPADVLISTANPWLQMTGGVNLKTAADFLAAGSAALGVGGELILSSALESNNTSAITGLAKQYVAIIKEVQAKKLAPV